MFGGTTEARILSEKLADAGYAVTVSVATEYGMEEMGSYPGVTVVRGRKTAEEIRTMLEDFSVCIDATHPYAVEVSENIRMAIEETVQEEICYFRLLRPASVYPEGTVFVSTAAEAAEYLAQTEGNVLLTTGAKELLRYASLPGERLYPRVLPLVSSLESCEQAGIPSRNVIAMQGPFSEELNLALLHSRSIRYLVTKDGGAVGGFPEKIRAAEQAGVQVIVISRPGETGNTWEEICDRLIMSRT